MPLANNRAGAGRTSPPPSPLTTDKDAILGLPRIIGQGEFKEFNTDNIYTDATHFTLLRHTPSNACVAAREVCLYMSDATRIRQAVEEARPVPVQAPADVIPTISQQMMAEIELWCQSITSPFVVDFYAMHYWTWPTQGDTAHQYFEYMDGGSLHDVTRRIGRIADERIVARIIDSAVCGVLYLVEKKLVKPGRLNMHADKILLNTRGEVKLSCPVQERWFDEPMNSNAFLGIPLNFSMAPERCKGYPVGVPAEVYPLGFALCHAATGIWPAHQEEGSPAFIKVRVPEERPKDVELYPRRVAPYTILHRMIDGDEPLQMPTDAPVSEPLRTLCNAMMAREPANRPTLSEVREDAWLASAAASAAQEDVATFVKQSMVGAFFVPTADCWTLLTEMSKRVVWTALVSGVKLADDESCTLDLPPEIWIEILKMARCCELGFCMY